MKVARSIIIFAFYSMAYVQLNAQTFSQYHHEATINSSENFDSLRKAYDKKLLLRFQNGFRFINDRYVSEVEDTITFADFTSRKAYFGLGMGYSLNRKSEIFVALDFMILPRDQQISNISFTDDGISGEGRGSGGFMFGGGIGYKFFFAENEFTRYYVSTELGFKRLIAMGGEISFSSSGGGSPSTEDLNSMTERTLTNQLSLGLKHRLTPVTMFDLNAGYLFSSSMEPIGRVSRIDGFNFSFGLHFILNPRK